MSTLETHWGSESISDHTLRGSKSLARTADGEEVVVGCPSPDPERQDDDAAAVAIPAVTDRTGSRIRTWSLGGEEKGE